MSASQIYSSVSSTGASSSNCTCLKGAYQSLVLLAAGSVTTAGTGISAAVIVPGALATDLVLATKTSGTANTGIGTAILAAANTAGANYVFTGVTAEAQNVSYAVWRAV